MNTPKITHGQFHCGTDCTIGENVVVDVDEEVRFGDRCVIPDNAYFCGRRATFGDDFYGYSWEWKRLDVGRGRCGEEDAVLTVGSRCTFHDNRIDLARCVTIGDDVGLSPEVVIYTHYYWNSPIDGFPTGYYPVAIGNGVLVGFRSTILPGVGIGDRSVIGAGSVVTGVLQGNGIYAGVPTKCIRTILPGFNSEHPQTQEVRKNDVYGILRRFGYSGIMYNFPVVQYRGMEFDLLTLKCRGEEDEYTDDFRWFLFRHGLKFYTKRPFKKLEK